MIFNGDPDYIPGSDYIFVQHYDDADELKRDGDIVLVPQPTDSPRDPLNWPKWRKFVQLAVIMFLRGVTCAMAGSTYSAVEGITKTYPSLNLNSFNTASGLLFAGLGGWSLLNAPSAYLYGIRISFIVSCLFSVIGNALYSSVSSQGMLLASQFFVGAATSVGESVALVAFAQICFHHQMNDVIGVFVLTTSVATFTGPLIEGYISQDLGWHWVGYMGLIFSCVLTVIVAFGLLETNFERHIYEEQVAAHAHGTVIEGVDASPGGLIEHDKAKHDAKAYDAPKAVSPEAGTRIVSPSPPAPSDYSAEDAAAGRDLESLTADKPKTYWQFIQVITPAKNIRGTGFTQYFKRVLLLLQVFTFPPVVFSGLQWSMQIGLITIFKNVQNEYWIKAPWNYGSGALSLMMIPNLIGSAIGAVYSTWAADWYVKWAARRNNGLREAETRLWLILPALILDPLGLLLFGAGTQYKWAWPVSYVALGFVGFGFGAAGEISISYMADCYPEMVLEGMVGIVFIYTMTALVICFIAQYWTALSAMNAMIAAGVLQFGILALMFPMIVWGKQCRKMTRSMYFAFVAKRDSLNRD